MKIVNFVDSNKNYRQIGQAETLEEAEAFLEDCMASIVDSIEEVKEFLDQEGMDISGMSDEEIEEASEVFALPDGRYLIVEG